MQSIFDRLGPEDITVHLLLNLQVRYPALDKHEKSSYRSRVKLRVTLLKELAERNNLPLGANLIAGSVTGVDTMLLDEICRELKIPPGVTIAPSGEARQVVLLNGGPCTGKSGHVSKLGLPDDAVCLDRDGMFDRLEPYPRLKKEAPDRATHAVVCEAILYNERDAYRYAVLSGAKNILADGTMSYLDLGLEMIRIGQECGCRVTVISYDCPIEDAEGRAIARAEATGKTINLKLLYESHVRCASNFFKYRELADATENWHNEGEEPSRQTASSVRSSDGMVSEDIIDADAIEELRKKGQLQLDSPSWPPNFDEFLDMRKEKA